jgi:hypothetical protein
MSRSLEEAETNDVKSDNGQDDSVAEDDRSFRSSKGYDADSESRYSLAKEQRMPCNDSCRRKKRLSDDVQGTQVTSEVLLKRDTKRRRRRRSILAPNCSWIERIFSTTPFAIPEDSDEFPMPYTTHITPVSLRSPTCAWLRTIDKIELKPTLHNDGLVLCTELHHDGHPLSFASISNQVASVDPQQLNLGVFTALMDKLNVQTLDDEFLALGLLTIVKDLLQDSYKSQATYRSYSFNDGGCMESLITVPETR